MHTIDLEEFKYGGTNITAFRLVDPENPLVHRTVSEWAQFELKSDKKPNERSFQVINLSSTTYNRDILYMHFLFFFGPYFAGKRYRDKS